MIARILAMWSIDLIDWASGGSLEYIALKFSTVPFRATTRPSGT